MKIVVIGATGFVGKNIVNELADRNHQILAISRKEVTSEKTNVKYAAIDVLNLQELANEIKDYDVVVSAYNAGWTNPNIYDDFIAGSNAIQQAVVQAGIKRYIVIGGAGSLYVAEDLQAVDTNDFPAEIKPGATAARDYFNMLKEENEIDWVFFSPAFEMHQGIKTGRTGKYRIGRDYAVLNDEGRSILSAEDLAVVIADEIENPKHHQVRFTAGY